MAPLIDPERLTAFKDALSNWQFKGYVQFDIPESSHRWLLREFDSITLDDVKRLMAEFVAAGGAIDEVRETRPEWDAKYPFHYDLRPSFEGKKLYIETRLHFHIPVLPDESWVLVVNIHAP